MNAITPGKVGQEAQASATPIEGELGELIRRTSGRCADRSKPRSTTMPPWGRSIPSSDAYRVRRERDRKADRRAGKSADFVHTEGRRVQREITDYAQLSQSALSSTAIMTESIAKWKAAIDAARKAGTGVR